MPSSILAPTALAGTSTDITITAGSTNTVAMYQGLSTDIFMLPSGTDAFLLPGGADNLLLSPQASKKMNKDDYGIIQLKDPDGEYFNSGMYLRHNGRFKTLGPGVWRVSKPVTTREIGFQSE